MRVRERRGRCGRIAACEHERERARAGPEQPDAHCVSHRRKLVLRRASKAQQARLARRAVREQAHREERVRVRGGRAGRTGRAEQRALRSGEPLAHLVDDERELEHLRLHRVDVAALALAVHMRREPVADEAPLLLLLLERQQHELALGEVAARDDCGRVARELRNVCLARDRNLVRRVAVRVGAGQIRRDARRGQGC